MRLPVFLRFVRPSLRAAVEGLASRDLRLAVVLSVTTTGISLAATGAGLSAVGALHLPNTVVDGNGPSSGEYFGSAIEVGDFDGDGFDDLAIGVPGDEVTNQASSSGSVIVTLGSSSGLETATSRRISQLSFEIESNDWHGMALAACDFDGDGDDDLAVGAPGEKRGESIEAGAVLVYPGGAGGLRSDDFVAFDQDTPGIPDSVEPDDRFGRQLACGRFNADGFADLAIAAPDESIGSGSKAGWVAVLRGSASGLDPLSAFAFTQVGEGLPTEASTNDQFGGALAVGDINDDGFDDLAIGVPGENVFAGMAHVLFGGPNGLSVTGALTLSEESLDGFPEPNDQFGRALAFGDFDGDDFDDLVIGVPYEDFASAGGPTFDNGQAVVVRGGATIPTPGGVAYWAENNIHGPQTSESEDRFGWALAAADFDADGFDDLAFGHPGEGGQIGAVTVIGGSPAGLTSSRRHRFAPAEAGVPGIPQLVSDANFGASLAAGDFDADGHADLSIGSPQEDQVGFNYVGAATVLRGALFGDGFESGTTSQWSAAP